ncbi:MAG TPA: hypothetical protein VHD36_07580 [Pirellulales bacterium]|nr:hypothetical protein [Pirellulales bacterium]
MVTARRVLLLVCAFAVADSVRADDGVAQAEREKKFAEALSGAVLVGTFSIDGVKTDKLPLAERYELKSVTKTKDGLWTFTARVKYLSQDLTLPITVPVVWAGDTPMVSLSDSTLPGLGSQLSAKVIFDGQRYAGTWQHGKFGGHMWGRIERGDDIESAPATDEKSGPAKPSSRE